jgi:hypothetical protein
VAALTDGFTRTGWTDVTPEATAGAVQSTYETTVDARRYRATIDDTGGEVWIYLAAA